MNEPTSGGGTPPLQTTPHDARDGGRPPGSTPPWYVLVAGAILLAILGVVVAILLRADDGEDTATVASSTSTADTPTVSASTTAPPTSADTQTSAPTTVPATSTTAPSTTADSSTTSGPTTTGGDPDPHQSAAWPPAGSAIRYEDPLSAARGFAEELIGFESPVYGPFQQGDTRSGEIEIRPSADGPVTVVFARQLGPDDTWWILGSAAADIVIDEPDALDETASPLRLQGQARSLDGNVDVEIRVDGSTTPLVTGSVAGGETELRPFDQSFPFVPPAAEAGTVILTTEDGDGSVVAASVVRVLFTR